MSTKTSKQSTTKPTASKPAASKPKAETKKADPVEEEVQDEEVQDEEQDEEQEQENEGESTAADDGQTKTKGLTILTEKAGLSFNVNWFDSHVRNVFDNNGSVCPKVSSFAPVALAAVNQTLCEQIIQTTRDQLQKDKANLYVLTRREIKIAIGFDAGLRRYFDSVLQNDDNNIYTEMYCMRPNKFKDYVDERFGKNVSVPQPALNLVVGLLLHTTNDLIDMANQFIEYAKRKTMDPRSVLAAVRTRFSPELADLLVKRATDAVVSAGGTIDEPEAPSADGNKKNAETKDGAAEKAAPTKGASTKAATSAPAKGAKPAAAAAPSKGAKTTTASKPAPKTTKPKVSVKDVTDNDDDDNAISDEEPAEEQDADGEEEAEEEEPVETKKKTTSRVKSS